MAQFRKKPVVIEAIQHWDDTETTREFPSWLMAGIRAGDVYETTAGTFIKTLEGHLHVSNGDWIIQGTQGELYPCKPDIFADIYERV